MPAIRKIVRDAAKDDNRFSAFVLGVVNSRAFQMTRADDVTTTNDEVADDVRARIVGLA